MNNSNQNQTPTNSTKKQYLAKVLIIGDGGVGKTALITRFSDNSFTPFYVSTIGVDFKSKWLKMGQNTVKLQIWDTAGQERFRNITAAYYRGASGIVMSFSVTDRVSFENVQKWMNQIQESAPKNCCKILIGTKMDGQNERVISWQQGQKLAIKMGINYFETSAKTGENVNQAFETLANQMYSKILTRPDRTNVTSQMLSNSNIISSAPKKRCC